jgi:predicted amidohydrolase
VRRRRADGVIGVYDKAHLPCCGADKFTTHGNTGFCVFETALGRIGMLICYDLRFPEAAWALALRGADIIALPTNWPTGADTAPEFMVRARAFENRVFVVACNRVGEERGGRYIGHGCIAAPNGEHLLDLDIRQKTRRRGGLVSSGRHMKRAVAPTPERTGIAGGGRLCAGSGEFH